MNYSLRVELAPHLERRLKKYAGREGIKLTEAIRKQIAALPCSDEEFNYSEFSNAYPRFIAKLRYWAIKRLGVSWQGDDLSFQLVEENIVALKSCKAIKEINSFFDETELSTQERRHLGQIAPVLNVEPEDWIAHQNSVKLQSWYDGFLIGEYSTLLEPVKDEVGGGAVTENQYGALVLNAPNMMIVDVDLRGDSLLEMDPVIVRSEKQALSALDAFNELQDLDELGWRIYRTAAGLRYICTTKLFGARNGVADRIMKQLFADPRYRALCRCQETFRARLTAKPWRANVLEDPQKWEMALKDGYRVCELIDTVGNSNIIEPLEEMIRHHDRVTGAEIERSEGLILA